jgi:hypothetical protein
MAVERFLGDPGRKRKSEKGPARAGLFFWTGELRSPTGQLLQSHPL